MAAAGHRYGGVEEFLADVAAQRLLQRLQALKPLATTPVGGLVNLHHEGSGDDSRTSGQNF